jgi:hypothetical protein
MRPAIGSDQNVTQEGTQGRGQIYYGWVIAGVCFPAMTLVAPVLGSFVKQGRAASG